MRSPAAPKNWVHLVFNFQQDKNKSDRDIIQLARDKVLCGKTHESSSPGIDNLYDFPATWDPVLSIELPVASTDFVDLLQGCDRLLETWIKDLDRSIGLPFDTNTLFRAPGKYNQVAVGVAWDYSCGSYYHREIEVCRKWG